MNHIIIQLINNTIDQISVYPTIMQILQFLHIVMKNTNKYDEYQLRQSAKNSVSINKNQYFELK